MEEVNKFDLQMEREGKKTNGGFLYKLEYLNDDSVYQTRYL